MIVMKQIFQFIITLIFACQVQSLHAGNIPTNGKSLPTQKLINVNCDIDFVKLSWKNSISSNYKFKYYNITITNIRNIDKKDGSEMTLEFQSTNQNINISAKDKIFEGAQQVSIFIDAVYETKEKQILTVNCCPKQFISVIPECLPPTIIEVKGVTNESISFEWSGPIAKPNDVRYEIRYKLTTNNKWFNVFIYENRQKTISGLETGGVYDFEIRKICDGSFATFTLYSEWKTIGRFDIALPQFLGVNNQNCGADTTITFGQRDTTEVVAGDTIKMNGLKILVQNIQKSGSGNNTVYSGFGLLIIPFGQNLLVKVEFSSIKQLDVHKNVINSDALAVSVADDPVNYSLISSKFGMFDGEICLTKNSDPGTDSTGINNQTGEVWDEYGFDTSGYYVKVPPYDGYNPGDAIDSLYNPNGFDHNGINVTTGTIYDQNGCNINGLDSLNQPCTNVGPPYYWIKNNNETEEGQDYFNSIQNDIDSILNIRLLELKADYEDKSLVQNNLCGPLRSLLEDKVDNYGEASRAFILGENDIYLVTGMSKEFESAPLKSNFKTEDKDPEMESIEQVHVDIYNCDVEYMVIKDFLDLINDVLSNADHKSQIKNEIVNWLKSLNKDQISSFENDPISFIEQWKLKLKELLSQKQLNGFSLNTFNVNDYKNIYGIKKINYTAQASTDLSSLQFYNADKNIESFKYEFYQGRQIFEGTERAFILQDLVNRKSDQNLFLTDVNSTLTPISLKNAASDGRIYNIFLENFKIQPTAASYDASIIYDFSDNDQKIVFKSLDNQFNMNGPKSNTSLVLAQDIPIRLSNAFRLILKEGSGIIMNCDGYSGLNILADLEICREYLIPLTPSPNLLVKPEPDRVKGHFDIFVPTWDEIFIDMTIDPFVVNGYEDYKWVVDTIALDFSCTQSPGGLAPTNYTSEDGNVIGGVFQANWRGVYIKKINVEFPNKWSKTSQTTQVSAQKLVIDKHGFSGNLEVDSLLNLPDGTLSGWAFSIQHFHLGIVKNQLNAIQMDGLINIPILQAVSNCGNPGTPLPDDCVAYSAFADSKGDYCFGINFSSGAPKCVPLWKVGSIKLDTSTFISVMKKGDDFFAVANLTGAVLFDTTSLIKIKESIKFQNLQISNHPNYFSAGQWALPNIHKGIDFGGFQLYFEKISIKSDTSGSGSALGFEVSVGLGDKKSNNVSAKGSFAVYGKMNTYSDIQKWEFDKIKMNGLWIEMELKGKVTVKGGIEFYDNDQTFGSGFKGALQIGFKMLGTNSSISAVAQFGRVNNYSYYFVDALMCSDLFKIGPYQVKGIGGGVWQNMDLVNSNIALPACPPDGLPVIPTSLGATFGGQSYQPNNIGSPFGLKLILGMATTNTPELFNSTTIFRVDFSKQTIKRAFLDGNGTIMSDFDLHANVGSSNLSAGNGKSLVYSLNIDLNFNEGVFDGNLKLYVNVADVIKGQNANYEAGSASFHLEKETGFWFFKLGSPNNRLGLLFGIGDFLNIKSGMYFQMGKGLDNPSIPKEMAWLTNEKGLIVQNRNQMLNGLIFGAQFSININ